MSSVGLAVGLTQLQQALRKAFQSVESSRKSWRAALDESASLLVSLGNLAEQFVALSKVDLSKSPLSSFPELEEKLRFKLDHAADTVMKKLYEKLSVLQCLKDSVSSQVSSVFQIQDQFCLDLQVLTSASASAPSVSEMMTWIQDIERHFRRQFVKIKALFLSLRANDFVLLSSAPEKWKKLSSPEEEERISDVLCRVSFFVSQ